MLKFPDNCCWPVQSEMEKKRNIHMYEAEPQMLVDRVDIIDTLLRYATSVDTRDWNLLLKAYTDEIEVDMLSIGMEEVKTMSAKEFGEMIERAVMIFDSTQHLLSNHVVNIDGDRATHVAYVQAQHFRMEGAEAKAVTMGGYYSNCLIRTPEGWRINKYKITITWTLVV